MQHTARKMHHVERFSMDTEGVVNRRMFVVIAVVVVAIDIASAQHESIYSARIHEVSMTGLVYNEI